MEGGSVEEVATTGTLGAYGKFVEVLEGGLQFLRVLIEAMSWRNCNISV